MSAEEQDRGGTEFDDPNREAVGLEPAGDRSGGEAPAPIAETTEAPAPEPEPAPPEPEGEGEDEG